MKNFLIIFTLIFLASCGAKKVYHTKVNIHPESSKYVESFAAQAGITINDLDITFAPLSDNSVLGYCQQGTIVKRKTGTDGVTDHVYKTPKVVLSTNHWYVLSLASREQLVFHELGHCLLNRPHTTTINASGYPTSIMYPYHLGTSIYTSGYSAYIAELFSKPSTAYAGMTFDGTKYASTIDTEFSELEVDDLSSHDLHDCVHNKGTVVIDETKNEEAAE